MKTLKSKLTSRKFWAAVTGFVSALLVLYNVDEITIERIIALLSAEGALIAYILTEGAIDRQATGDNDEPDT